MGCAWWACAGQWWRMSSRGYVSRPLYGSGLTCEREVAGGVRPEGVDGRRARAHRMAGAPRIWRVPRTAGVTGIQACSSRRPARRGKRERNGGCLDMPGFGCLSTDRGTVSVSGRHQVPNQRRRLPRHRAQKFKGSGLHFLVIPGKGNCGVQSLLWVLPARSLPAKTRLGAFRHSRHLAASRQRSPPRRADRTARSPSFALPVSLAS